MSRNHLRNLIQMVDKLNINAGYNLSLNVHIVNIHVVLEVKAQARITKANIHCFIWKSIIYRFDLPRAIITDNGHQFDNAKFAKFYRESKIAHCMISVVHLQSNDETEVANQT